MDISSISSQITSNIFSKIDTNDQGYIDKSKLSSILSGISDTDESNSEEIFNQIDTNGDGKITKSELSQGVENLLSQLQSDSLSQMKDGAPPPNGMQGMPPPPPPADAENEGVTEEQAAEIASTTTDSNLASLMQTISENFEAADTDQDGKVTREEAMSYAQGSSAGNSTLDAVDSNTDNQNMQIQNIIAELVKAYGFETDLSSSLSTSA